MVGKLSVDIAQETGFNCTVILPCTHDTGSAYLAVPSNSHTEVFLSSGTWSLIGIETEKPVINEKSLEANFANEGGVRVPVPVSQKYYGALDYPVDKTGAS
jgi:rhamnulokinase